MKEITQDWRTSEEFNCMPPVRRKRVTRLLRLKGWAMIALGLGSLSTAQALQVTVAWDINSSGQLGFNVERSADGTNFTQVATVPPTINTFADTNLPAGSYWYRVRAFDSVSQSPYSNVASTQIAASPPSITTQPTTSQTVNAGANVALTIVVSGNPAPSVQWRKNGNSIPGATNATLTLNAVSSLDAATYTAVVTNSGGSVTSNNAVLNVQAAAPVVVAPVITKQPSTSQSVTAGVSVSFAVEASGTPAPSIQWRKNGIAIPGASSATLTFSAVTSLDAATYTAVATNSAGSATSNNSVLNVQAAPVATAAPKITKQPVASQTVTAGSNVSLTVAASGTPTPTYQWRKNGNSISGATSATLTLNAITTGGAGTYTVRVTNSAGSVTSGNAVLNVQVATVAPKITAQPAASQTVTAGANVSLTVEASGTPAPSIQWRKNGITIPGASSATLTLSATTSSDEGTYTVIATNSAGSVTSSNALVYVKPADTVPVFTTQPSSQSVTAGSNLSLSAAATGFPTPTLQWKKNGVAVAGATAGTLVLTNVTGADAGTYTVVATNSAGAVTSTAASIAVSVPVVPSPAPVPESSPSRIQNFSARAVPMSGQTMELDFTIADASQSVLLRGIGPGLSAYTTADTMDDPKLALTLGRTTLATNDNWGGSAALTSTFTQVGAFPLAARSKDAVILRNVLRGTYTSTITGKTGGLALLEIYDTETGKGRISQLEVRAPVGRGAERLIAGFTITGSTPLRVLIRAIGPGLGSSKANLIDPQLELHRGSTLVERNDNWGGTYSLTTAFNRAGASNLSSRSRDAAILVTLAPGTYSATVSGMNNTTGVAQLEIYEIE